MSPRVVLYGRQSKGNVKSIADQLKVQISDAAEAGLTVTETLQDEVSASRYAKKVRTDWPKLLELIASHQVDYVSLWDSSRGDRKTADWVDFLDLCMTHNVLVRIASQGTTYDMSVTGHYRTLVGDGLDADIFSRNLAKNTRRGLASNAAAGKPPGKLTYGYMREYDRGKVVDQVPHPQQSDVVRRIFKEFSEGRSMYRIVADLEADQVPSPKETRWTHASIRRILLNRTYLGERWHNGEFVGMAVWPALIDGATFATVGEILADPSRNTRKDGSFKHWLSGIARCGKCGHIMRVQKVHGKLKYSCDGKRCVNIFKDVLEDYVAEEVRARMLKLDERPSDPAKYAKRQHALNEIARLSTLIDSTEQAIQAGTVKQARGDKRIADAEQLIAGHQKVAEANIADKVVRVIKAAGTDWFSMTAEQRHTVAQNLVTVTVLPVGRVAGNTHVPAENRVLIEDAELEVTELDTEMWVELSDN